MTSADHETDAALRAYVEARQATGDLLRQTRAFADRAAPWMSDRVRELMTRLAEDRFQLVVVGQFKRGKTSLINAIVGRRLLPTGSIPVTLAITSLKYGPVLRASVRRAGRAFNQEIPIGELPAYITERGNPGNHKRVLSATVEVPAPFLRRGLHFVDTPGIGSAHEHNTAATLAFLPEADAAVFVTGADAPLSEAELEFLDAVRAHVRKMFFVLNKIDQLNDDERREVTDYTARILAARLGSETIRLYALSAASALAAGPQADQAVLAASGLPVLEGALAEFLSDERRTVFLVALLDRTVATLEEARVMLGLRQRAREQGTTEADRALVKVREQFDEVERERQALVARVAERVAAWDATVLEEALQRFAAETRDAIRTGLASAELSCIGSRHCYAEACAWLRGQLEHRTAGWLRGMTADIHAFCDTLIGGVQQDFAAVFRQPQRLVESLLGAGAKTTSQPELEQTAWTWVAPAFEPHEAERGVSLDQIAGRPARIPLPRGVARARARRAIERRLADDISLALAGSRKVVLGYLNACVLGIDISSGGRLAEERRRIEQVIDTRPKPGMEKPAHAADVSIELDALLARATALRTALLRHEPLPEPVPAGPVSPSTEPSDARTALKQDAQSDADPAGVTHTCAICSAASDAVFDFLCHYQYAIGHDAAGRSEFLASHGLCPIHTWHLERLSSPRGLSASYPVLLEHAAKRVRAMVGLPRAGVVQRLDEFAAGTRSCAACLVRQASERTTVERLSRTLSTAEGLAIFERSQWLCLSHLRQLLTVVGDDVASSLLGTQARRLVQVSEAMREYVLKLEAGRGYLLTDEEARAYRQALVLLVGERYLFRTESEE